MAQWKLATVLLAASVIAVLICLTSAAQVWSYPFPRTVFLNGALLFGWSAIVFFVTVFFLDDISSWVKNIATTWIRGFFSFLLTILFSILMFVALYLSVAGGKVLLDLSDCAFESVNEKCVKTQSQLTEVEMKQIKKTMVYHLSLGGRSDIRDMLDFLGFEVNKE